MIENCTFTGTVDVSVAADTHYSDIRAGGIVGSLGHFGETASVKNCTFSGTVRVMSSYSAAAGGIAADAVGGSIENCTVKSGSEVYAQSTYSDTAAYAGGIVGHVGADTYDTKELITYITGCVSYAKLTEAGYKGGIVGHDPLKYGAVERKSSLSGNTWPTEYPERGEYNSSSDTNNTPDIPSVPNEQVSPDDTPQVPVNPQSPDISDTTPASPDIELEQPVIPQTPTDTQSPDKTPSSSSSSSSGGGCNTGTASLILAALLAFKFRKH